MRSFSLTPPSTGNKVSTRSFFVTYYLFESYKAKNAEITNQEMSNRVHQIISGFTVTPMAGSCGSLILTGQTSFTSFWALRYLQK